MKLTDEKLSALIADLQSDYDTLVSHGAACDDAHGQQFLQVTDEMFSVGQVLDSLKALSACRLKVAAQANFRDASHK